MLGLLNFFAEPPSNLARERWKPELEHERAMDVALTQDVIGLPQVVLTLANHAWIERLKGPEPDLLTSLPQLIGLIEEAYLARAHHETLLNDVA